MKVFLSSTYNDLVEHRKAAHDALEQLGLQVVWMESFGSRPVESTKACLDEVEECELFVGIYAYRYGYIPDGKGVSITEEEFNHAQKLGKHIFGFIVKDDYPWQPKNIEHDKRAELDSLLIKVKKQPVEFFTTPDNLANGISSSIGRHLISELEKKAQGEGKKLLDRLKLYVDSTKKKRIEDDISSFVARLKKAMLLAKAHGTDAFAELVSFSLIRSSLLTQTRKLPEDYYLLKAMLDGIVAAEESVENIGDPGRRALAYAALTSSNNATIELKNEFARRAMELSKRSGAEWEQSSNQSRIGFLLINSVPTLGVGAFKLAMETIKKAKDISYIDIDIFETPIEEFEKAYKRNPSAISSILNDFVNFVGSYGGFALLLDFAKALFSSENALSREILAKAYVELTKSTDLSKIPDHRWDDYERQNKINIEKFIEISLLLSENQLAENIIQETKFDFNTKNFLTAIGNIASGDFEQIVKISASSTIRKEAIVKLFELDRPKEGIKLLSLSDFGVIDDVMEIIIRHNLVNDLITAISDQKEKDDFFSFAYDEAIVKLKIDLARELYSKKPEESRKLINELVGNKESEPYKFSYWGEAALIMESGIRWGQQKTNELIGLSIDNFQEQLHDAEKIIKKSAIVSEKPADEMQIVDFKDRLKELGEVISMKSNNFIYAWFSYEKHRNWLVKRLTDNDPSAEIFIGRNYLEGGNWDALDKWILSLDFSNTNWAFDFELVEIVRDLVFKGKLDLAKKISANLDLGTKWQADTWISIFPLLTELTAYDFEGFEDPDHIFLIRAEAISKHSPSIASAYVNLYCEYCIKEKWLDDALGWDLCNLALFLYKQNDKANAYKYFVLGIQHWFQYAMETEDTWNEIVEKLVEVDFDLQFLIAQDILLWNSNRNIDDVARTIQMFSMFLVKNFEYEHVVEVLKAMKRSRDWHLDDLVV